MREWYTVEPWGNGYTVFYAGEEVWFKTVEEAEAFIDEICKEQ